MYTRRHAAGGFSAPPSIFFVAFSDDIADLHPQSRVVGAAVNRRRRENVGRQW